MNELSQKEYEEILEEVLKKFNVKRPTIPSRIMEQSTDKIIKIYGEAYRKLFSETLEILYSDFGVLATPSYQSQLGLLKLIEGRLNNLHLTVTDEIRTELSRQYVMAQAFHTIATETVKDLNDFYGHMPYTELNHYKMEQIVQDTMEDLLFVTQHTNKEIKKLVRDTFAKNIQYHGLQNESQKHLKQIIERQLSKQGLSKSLSEKGFVGITDKSGRKWNLKTYVDMAVNTKMTQAYTEGLKDSCLDSGKDLAIIPDKSSKDSCKNFEGMIISMTGQTTGFMTYDQLKATGLIFHPRCRHTVFPTGKLENLPEEDIAYHEKKMAELKKLKKEKKI